MSLVHRGDRPVPLRCVLAATLVAAASCGATAKVVDVIEYHNATLGHYFITSLPAEIVALDTGSSRAGSAPATRSRRTTAVNGTESRLPLLHPAGAGRFALLLGVAWPSARRRSSHVPDVHRRVDRR